MTVMIVIFSSTPISGYVDMAMFASLQLGSS